MVLQTWLLYLIAVIGLAFAPGPNGLLALTHGVLYGRSKAIWTIIGGVLGFVVVIALSMFGIGAIIQTSPSALNILKWVGGAYLIWLGIQLWRTPPVNLIISEKAIAEKKRSALFMQGALAAVSNPKVLLFFGAFLPQFIDPQMSLMTQFFVMALTFSVVEFTVEFMLASVSVYIGPWLEKRGKRFNQVCGGLFMVIGVALPLTQ
ncbi:LysE family translocator [Photobacterium profundum]|uniref:Putative transporter protein n=1 Tax=Photobacterium profundum 3TCK TaxID=314280 RepID=Q1Z6F3_9GAMM|nr:LysE family translocator [Photobacterium profundum]EAS44194.1 putative transporter protein [Photobacterium profundum 3TCK]PSV59806.1 LysE family translocator [Photobacterium profundum]